MHLGEFDQAISAMRDKLARQEKEKLEGAGLYSSYANLGTAMMIDAIVKSSAGKDSSDELRESLMWVRKSIEVNPEAHFGREVWQVVLGEFLLAAAKDPKLLKEYDFIGNELNREIHSGRAIDGRPAQLGQVMPSTLDDSKITPEARAKAREWIMPIGAGRKWTERAHPSNERPVPFDEPVLGIVGMWRYGGGANPFFSLALAETMLRVGQSHVAWSGYERTTMLLGGLPDKKRVKWLTEHCRSRQREIESNLSEQAEDLRAAFKADLKAGLDYQGAYQKYEAERIGKGDSIADPHFYDAFFAGHGEIASDPGLADSQKVVTENFGSRVFVPALLLAGIFAFVTAVIRWSSGKGR